MTNSGMIHIDLTYTGHVKPVPIGTFPPNTPAVPIGNTSRNTQAAPTITPCKPKQPGLQGTRTTVELSGCGLGRTHARPHTCRLDYTHTSGGQG